MPRRHSVSSKKPKAPKAPKDPNAAERSVAAVYSRSAPGSGSLPLRLLTDFELLVGDETGAERYGGLEELHHGRVDGLPLHARGRLLEHRSAAAAGMPDTFAANTTKGHIELPSVRDWVVDHSQPAAIWLITNVAWYRLMTPAVEYIPFFQAALLRLRLAVAGADLITDNIRVSYQEAEPRLLEAVHNPDARAASTDSEMEHDAEEAADASDPYEAASHQCAAAGVADVAASATFLLPQLAPFAGRHLVKCGLAQQLAAIAGTSCSDAATTVRKLRDGETGAAPADFTKRPAPQSQFLAPPELLPGILMVWDFCQRFRQLLRLPAFPLARLELAFLDKPPSMDTQQQLAASQASVLDSDGSARFGAVGQGLLLRDIHVALLRVLESAEEEAVPLTEHAEILAPPHLGPQDAFRPLMGVTWPEMTRTVLHSHPFAAHSDAAITFRLLKGQSYEQLGAGMRLAMLEALLHVAADSESVRAHMQAAQPFEPGAPGLLGVDAAGARYFQLAAQQHGGRLYAEAPQGGKWGWYNAEQLPGLLAWLESGSDAEQALADAVFEGYQQLLPASLAGGQPTQANEVAQPSGMAIPAADGYAGLPPLPSHQAQLSEVLSELVKAAPFWGHGEDWLACRAAVLASLLTASTGRAFARLLWLVEELIYEEALRGTGWGRRRGWLRDQLDKVTTVSQAAMVAAALASHCRRGPDMGLLDGQDAFLQVAAELAAAPPTIPDPQDTVVLAGQAYQQVRSALQPSAPPLDWPAGWRPLETCTVLQVLYTRGQPPITRAAAEDITNAAAWVLLEPQDPSHAPPPPDTPLPADCDGEIDWTLFSFSHGFRYPRAAIGSALAGPRLVAVKLLVDSSREHVSVAITPIKQSAPTPPAGSSPTSSSAAAAASSWQQSAVSSGSSAALAAMAAPNAAQHGNSLAARATPDAGQHGGSHGRRSAAQAAASSVSAAAAAAAAEAHAEDEDMAGNRVTRRTRNSRTESGAAEFYELDRDNLARVKAEPVPQKVLLGGLRRTASGQLVPVAEDTPIQFWVKRRHLVAVELRPAPPGSCLPRFLLPPSAMAEAQGKRWPAGMAVKMQVAGELPTQLASDPDQASRINTALAPRWHTGVLPHGFDPAAAGAAVEPNRLVGALNVAWDEQPIPRLPPRVSPWDITEDTSGLRGSRQVERARAEALAAARQVAPERTRLATSNAAGRFRMASQAAPGPAMAHAAGAQMRPQQQEQQQQRQGITVPAAVLAALPERQRRLLAASRAAAAKGQMLPPELHAELMTLYRQLQAHHNQQQQQQQLRPAGTVNGALSRQGLRMHMQQQPAAPATSTIPLQLQQLPPARGDPDNDSFRQNGVGHSGNGGGKRRQPDLSASAMEAAGSEDAKRRRMASSVPTAVPHMQPPAATGQPTSTSAPHDGSGTTSRGLAGQPAANVQSSLPIAASLASAGAAQLAGNLYASLPLSAAGAAIGAPFGQTTIPSSVAASASTQPQELITTAPTLAPPSLGGHLISPPASDSAVKLSVLAGEGSTPSAAADIVASWRSPASDALRSNYCAAQDASRDLMSVSPPPHVSGAPVAI